MFLNGELITELVTPSDITSIPSWAFMQCKRITKVTLSEGLTTLNTGTFHTCTGLKTVIFPSTLTAIGAEFFGCSSMQLCDFRSAVAVPSLSRSDFFGQATPPCKIVVPDSLYDEWIDATNWSSLTSYIIKASEYTEA